MFLTESSLSDISWQGLERAIYRLLMYEGFTSVRLVGQSRDEGGDLIGQFGSKRWLFQVKRWTKRVGGDVVARTLHALSMYDAQLPVIVALGGFEDKVYDQQRVLMSERVSLQLWDRKKLVERSTRLPSGSMVERFPGRYEARRYQEDAISAIVASVLDGHLHRALIVMATGLGKTLVAAEAIRRLSALRPGLRVLAIAHSNDLVYQLERSFWPFLRPDEETIVWNGQERPHTESLNASRLVFACLNTVADALDRGQLDLAPFDLVVVDECHHVGGSMYETVLTETRAGASNGPFLLGLTATPWRADADDLDTEFGAPLVSIDLVTGLKSGFLANVDYRMFTDNIDWSQLAHLKGLRFTPRAINRTLFIAEWDDAVVIALAAAWKEQDNPRCIVFCGTIDHALRMRDRINALGFCNAAAVFSAAPSQGGMQPWERNRILCDFEDGKIGTICAVDIFNEGIDVPDVNIIVFQRVTHSRRIFIQQLGRGLRLTPGKAKVIVLDFVSDIRRFAAGIELKDGLSAEEGPRPGRPYWISLPNRVTFTRVGAEDPESEKFLRQWLEDVSAVETAGEDTAVLRFPPSLAGGRT